MFAIDKYCINPDRPTNCRHFGSRTGRRRSPDPYLGPFEAWPRCHDLGGVKRHVDVGLKGRAWNVDVFKEDVDQVLSRLSRQVGDRAGSVAVVRALDLGLRRPLHGQAQTSGAGALRVDGELCWAAHQTSLQTGARCFHLEKNVT